MHLIGLIVWYVIIKKPHKHSTYNEYVSLYSDLFEEQLNHVFIISFMSFTTNLFCGGVWYISVLEDSLKSALKIIRLYMYEISSCLRNGYPEDMKPYVLICILLQYLKDKIPN